MHNLEIVVDEWIVHYLSDKTKSCEVRQFIDKLIEKCDKILIPHGSKLERKIWELPKLSANFPARIRDNTKRFFSGIVKNSDKCRFVELSNSSVGTPLETMLEPIPHDDRYLIATALMMSVKVIVTTDQRLIDIVSPIPELERIGLKIQLLDEFLTEYLES